MLFIGTHDAAILTGGTETVQAYQDYNTITTDKGNDTIRFAGLATSSTRVPVTTTSTTAEVRTLSLCPAPGKAWTTSSATSCRTATSSTSALKGTA